MHLLPRGLGIPEDISLMVVDARPSAGVIPVEVSSIGIKPYDMGYTAADILTKIIAEEIAAPVNTRVPMKLDFRPSPLPQT